MDDFSEQITFCDSVDTPAVWHDGSAGFSAFDLKTNDIHVWSFRLDVDSDLVHQYRDTLSSDERNRAERFKLHHHRNRYITGRGLLRVLLGKYLDLDPAQLTFAYGPFGKPSLVSRACDQTLHFNLAHSEDLALIAITESGPIGVDLEWIRFLPDFAELVERFFSTNENSLFQALPAEKQCEAFFNLWTRKEAWLKATGQGISKYLNQVEVSFVPGEPARLISLPDDLRFKNNWLLREFIPGAGFTAALATEVELPKIHFLRAVGQTDRQALIQA